MYRKVPVRLGKGRWETYTTTVVKGTHRFLHGCYGRRNALLGTTKTADLTGPCPIKSDGYPSRIVYSVSLQALKKRLKQSAGNGSHKRFAHSLSAGQYIKNPFKFDVWCPVNKRDVEVLMSNRLYAAVHFNIYFLLLKTFTVP